MKLLREELSLDGEWLFEFNGEPLGSLAVPQPWEVAFPNLREVAGTGTYERTFTVPKAWRDKAIVLHIGASDFYTEVFVNGQSMGTHSGGYTPIALPIQEAIDGYGENHPQTVTITVTDATKEQDTTLPTGSPLCFKEIPHGKQSWYTSVSGIWQSVKLVALPHQHIQRAHLIGDVDTETVQARLLVQGVEPEEDIAWEINVEVYAPNSDEPLLTHRYPFLPTPNEEGEARITSTFALPEPLLWHPDTPHLYTAVVSLEREGKSIDSLTKRFGMRKIETREGWVWLNNSPIFLVGVLDQAFYPQTIYTPPSEAYLRDQFLKAKELGLNLMRCHIKVPTESYLDLCDEIGLLVWYEVPNGKELTSAYQAHSHHTFRQMWNRDASHPSICFASIINESWGIDLNVPEQRDWLKESYYWAKSLATTWLIVDNSPCIPNFHVVTDLDDYHIYFNIPDHAQKYSEFMQAFANRTYNTWTPYGDADRRGNEPLILSEFGNWGLPRLEPIAEAEGGSIWWFPTGWDAAIPEGVLERFEEQGLSRAFGDYNALADASQWQEYLALKWEIEEMRLYSSIGGYVITEFTDLNWECNGLLDFARGRKVFHEAIASVLAQDVLIPRLEPSTSFRSGDFANLCVSFSNFTGREARGGSLQIRLLEKTLSLPITSSTPIGTTWLTSAAIPVPEVSIPQKTQMEITLLSAEKEILATTTQSLVLLPASVSHLGEGTTLWTPSLSETAQTGLQERGFTLTTQPHEATKGVFSEWTPEAEAWVHSGGTGVLVLQEGHGLEEVNSLALTLESRDKQGRWGDWCGAKTWFTKDACPSLPDTTVFDFEYQGVVPTHILTGMAWEEVLSGLYVGWLRAPAGIVVRRKLGKGTLIVTTFTLLREIAEDSIAALILHDLLKQNA
jgi:hypothetical protein